MIWGFSYSHLTFSTNSNNTTCLLTEVSLKYEGLFREANTNVVWNVQIVIGQPDAVSAHLVDQVFPDNDNLLAAVLDPERKNMAGQF